jgi:hypothetical protein
MESVPVAARETMRVRFESVSGDPESFHHDSALRPR